MGMPQLRKKQLWNWGGELDHQPGYKPGSALKDEVAKQYLFSRKIILKAYFAKTQRMYSQIYTL